MGINGPDVVSTGVYGTANKTDVNVKSNNNKSEVVATEVVGNGNMTTININNYNEAKKQVYKARTHTPGGTHKTPASPPSAKNEQPHGAPAPTPTQKKQEPSEPKISIREIEQRAQQLAKASNVVGTDEEAFYTAVTTVPGGETESSSKPGDVTTMDKRVFLSKDNLIALDKYLKTHQMADVHRPSAQAGGIRSYINAEFDIKDRSDFYNNKMRELVNLLDEYKIK